MFSDEYNSTPGKITFTGKCGKEIKELWNFGGISAISSDREGNIYVDDNTVCDALLDGKITDYKEYIDMDFKCLYTDRLIIRRLKLSNKEDFFRYRSHRNVIKYQSWKPKNIQEIEDFIQSMNEIHPNIPGTWFQMALCIKETDKMIGDVGLHFFETNFLEVEIGYTISPDFQGKGYGIEAVRGILNYLFEKLHKHRVFASVDPENKPSIALLERAGMKKEAHFRKNIFIDGEWVDECIYAILDEEWQIK